MVRTRIVRDRLQLKACGRLAVLLGMMVQLRLCGVAFLRAFQSQREVEVASLQGSERKSVAWSLLFCQRRKSVPQQFRFSERLVRTTSRRLKEAAVTPSRDEYCFFCSLADRLGSQAFTPPYSKFRSLSFRWFVLQVYSFSLGHFVLPVQSLLKVWPLH